jgi:tRNA-splicing ligase RtcB (3'-phosphate/5'-hydroxy nucleic acid ligase)
MVRIKKINDFEWEIPKEGKMNVPIVIFSSENLLKQIKKDDSLVQAENMASLPGVVGNVILCPDSHEGYGACIGGVAAFDSKKGIISPGMVGFDINCGVRLLSTNISKEEFLKKRKEVLHDIKRTIPSGVGRGGERYSREQIKEVLVKGSEWAIENGLGTKEDLERTEENGRMFGADAKDVSDRALSRGLPQLGTLGAGNHFIDILEVEEIFKEETAKVFGLERGSIAILIHCGSRGLGHQVASDYMRAIEEKHGWPEQDRELAFAPIDSEFGKKYFSAMKCSVNFAFCNRQIIMHKIRQVLERHFPNKKSNLVYDIAHNIAKIEEHLIDGKKKDLLVVRKGATRSFGSGNKEVPEVYKKVGQPVLIPGSMSTPSFVLVGAKESEEKSFSSSAHGAGRAHSRTWTHKELTLEKAREILEKKDIVLEGGSKGTIEESELAYKDIEEVINVTEKAGLSKKVAKLKPLAVMIG